MTAAGRLGLLASAPVFALAGCLALWACGALRADNGFATDGPHGDAGGEESRAGMASDGSMSAEDSGAPPPLFTQSDAIPAPPKGSCKPGTYAGTFTTSVTIPDAGLLSDLFTIAWNGTLSLTLQGQTSTTQAGEFSNTTLVIAPGAKLSGSDQYGGTFNADLTGQLDCPSRVLSGALDNGAYTNSTYLGLYGDGGTVTLVGTLAATYDPVATPVALDNGSITASSPDVQGLVAMGTWLAALQ